MTTKAPVSLCLGVSVGQMAGQLYSVPQSATVRITAAAFVNTSGAAASLTVNIVPQGAAPTLSNQILGTIQVADSETYVADELIGHVLSQLASIWASTGSSATFNAFISGEIIQ